MNIKLERPLAFFDLETTGLDISSDRIIEISILKLFPNGKKISKTWLINPEITIPKESTLIHGITNEQVKNSPKFNDISIEVKNMLVDADLAGYNSNKFDIPLLMEEFIRCKVDFNLKEKKKIDIQNIFHKMEKRDLTTAYNFYCSKKLANAHSAESDTKATYEILISQIDKYKNLENNVNFLDNFSNIGEKFIDAAGFVRMNDNNEEIFSFGKYKNRSLKEVFNKNPGYFSWIKNANFPIYTKNIVNDIINKIKLEKKFKSER